MCQMENKTKVILQVPNCNKGRTCFIFIFMQGRSFVLSSHKVLTFDNRMAFVNHFEEILERCNQKFQRLRIFVNKKWGPSPEEFYISTNNV